MMNRFPVLLSSYVRCYNEAARFRSAAEAVEVDGEGGAEAEAVAGAGAGAYTRPISSSL
jgi:hypothetical protein